MKNFLVLTFWFCSLFTLWGQNERQNLRKGNKFFEEGKYTEAELAYLRAISKKKDMTEGTFNLGGAMYKQDKYSGAIELYQALAGTVKDKKQLADIYHNMGNSLLKSGKIKESVDAYKQALRNNPMDDQTRYNLAFAQKKLKDQQQKQQQNKDQQKQEQQQKQQQKKDQQQQQKEDQKDKQDQQQQNQQNQEQQQPQQSPRQNQISQEDARRLLEALQQDEKETQERVKKAKAKSNRSRRVEKDW